MTPLCTDSLSKGTPRNVRTASTNTATMAKARTATGNFQVMRACNAAPSSSQVTKAQVSSGSQAQKRPQASRAQAAPATSITVWHTNANAIQRHSPRSSAGTPAAPGASSRSVATPKATSAAARNSLPETTCTHSQALS